MHRLPKIFSHSPGRRKSRADSSSDSSSSRRAEKPKKLERSYALKHINYEFSPPNSASSSSYSPEESLRTRSLDLYGGKTSFRVDGTEGEFEIICKAFGVSGIEDFAISPEEYEAVKVKSCSASVVFSKKLDPIIYQKTDADCDDVVECSDFSGGTGVLNVINRKMEGCDLYVGYSDNKSDAVSTNNVVSAKLEETGDFGCMDRYKADVFGNVVTELSERLRNGVRINDVSYNDRVRGRSNVSRGNGIKGMQPTVVVPHPTSRGFLLDSDPFVSGFRSGFCLNEDEEGTEEVGQDRSEREKDRGTMVMTREGSCVLSESSSFTSNDDDSSSTVTEPMSSISSNERYRCVIENWQKGELLGRGSFGSVYEGIADDGFFLAVKEVSLLDQGTEGKQCIMQLEQEIALLSQFEHENIVRYYGTKKDESHLYIFLELVTKGSLLSLYQKYELRGPIASAYTRQILHGLKYLHDRNVVHRDIKCANILVHTNGLVKLADFGLAKAAKLNDVKSCKGTAYWMAPEVVRCKGYGLAADIWSLGCTVLEMLTRRFPYADLEYMSALYKIGQGVRPHVPDTLPRDARNFILQCLQVDPRLRPTAAQLLDHPFVKRPLASSSSTDSPRSFGRLI